MKRIAILLSMLVISACSGKEPPGEATPEFVENDTIRASGEIASSESIIISPPNVTDLWEFKIIYLAPEGAHVKKGELLVEFESSPLGQRLNEKQNALLTAEKKLETKIIENDAKHETLKLQLAEAVMNYEKADLKWQQSRGLESKLENKRLALLNQIAADDVVKYKRTINKSVETAKAVVARISNEVLRLQSEVKQYQTFIQNMKATSPGSGIVVYKANQSRVKHSIGDSVWKAEQIMELTSPADLIVNAEIQEADAGRIAVGQDVDIILDAAPDRVFKGQIRSLGPIFRRKSIGQPNIIIDAKISIDHIDLEVMRPGMAARVQIITTTTIYSGGDLS